MSVIGVLLWVLVVYLAIGALVAVRFVLIVAPKVDPVFAEAPLRVRILFFPGAVSVWPIVLKRSRDLLSVSREESR